METIQINPADNVAVAIEALKAGTKINVNGKDIIVNSDVPAGHKILLTDLNEGENVIKYGYPIGHLKENHKATLYATRILRQTLRGFSITHTHLSRLQNLPILLITSGLPTLTFLLHSRATDARTATWAFATKCGLCQL